MSFSAKLKSAFSLFALVVCFALPQPVLAAAAVPPSFADLVEHLTPAVVNISTAQKVTGKRGGQQGFAMPEIPPGQQFDQFRDFMERFGEGQEEKGPHEVYSLGSGFIIDADGYIATNYHVVADADEITVTLSDNSKYKAKVIGRDAKTDLALLKVDAKKKLPFVPFGNSDAARVGDWVIAIGNPFGLGGTVTAGIVSARARNIHSGPFDDFIQTDAPINRGNSGGPMFNMNGEVIGINAAIFSPSGGSIGIGFAVPTSLAQPILQQLRSGKAIQRGWLGVRIQEVNDEVAESVGLHDSKGALVTEINKGSPAGKAGIKVGDVILRFDGKEIKEMRQLPRFVADTRIGSEVKVEVWREGRTHDFTVKIGELKESDEKQEGEEDGERQQKHGNLSTRQVLGMELADLNDEMRQELGLDAKVQGIAVIEVKPDSEAARRGVNAGDVILQVGDTKVATAQAFEAALKASGSSGRKFALVQVQRGNDITFITLPVEEAKKGK